MQVGFDGWKHLFDKIEVGLGWEIFDVALCIYISKDLGYE